MNEVSTNLRVCPCCGYETFPLERGSYELCPVCFWSDIIVDLIYFDEKFSGGNKTSLRDAQRNFILYGVYWPSLTKIHKDESKKYKKNMKWRKLNENDDSSDITPEISQRICEIFESEIDEVFDYWSEKYFKNKIDL